MQPRALRSLQPLSDDAAAPIHGWQGTKGGLCACTRTIRLSQEHVFRLGSVAGLPAISYTTLSAPTYTERRLSLHPHFCIPLSQLSRDGTSINPLIGGRRRQATKTSARRPVFTISRRRHLVDDNWWRCEKASNPNVGSLTVSTALVSKRIVVFSSSIYDGAVNRFLPPTMRCEPVPWMTGIVEIDINSRDVETNRS